MALTNAVSGMWVGDALSPIEQLSLSSYLYHGYEVSLYTYGPVGSVPRGVTVRDGAEILPARRIFAYKYGDGQGSFSAFSNMFRYKLMLTRDTYWTDVDVVALKRLPDDEEVFGWEDHEKIGSAVLRFQVDSEVLAECYLTALQKGSEIYWGDAGPSLLTRLIKDKNLDGKARSVSEFYPVHYSSWMLPFDPDTHDEMVAVVEHSSAVHLWNEMARRADFDKANAFVQGSWIAQIARAYLPR